MASALWNHEDFKISLDIKLSGVFFVFMDGNSLMSLAVQHKSHLFSSLAFFFSSDNAEILFLE